MNPETPVPRLEIYNTKREEKLKQQPNSNQRNLKDG
jgi:hypothetical protein